MKIALCQINPIIGDFAHQYQRILKAADHASAQGCDLAIFPELALCGYPPRDLLEQGSFIDAGKHCLDKLVKSVRGMGVIVGSVTLNPGETGNALFNTAVLFEDGNVLAQVNKQLLPTYDVFDEHRYFEPGESSRPVAYKGHRIGLTICEDAWNDKAIFKRRKYTPDPVAQLADDGADLIINLSASPFHIGKGRLRDSLLSTKARKHGITMVFVNQVGGNDHILFDGSSAVYDEKGRVVARAADFEEDFVIYDTQAGSGPIRELASPDAEAVLQALVMGTRDYVHKCGFEKVVVGLSGGIDSALTALVAVQALGAEHVATVFMPSDYTSQDNFEDTQELARRLGTTYDIIPIDDVYKAFVGQLVPNADPNDPGITEQNIQARIRGTLLMGISNRDGALVLTTGNKSELAVGYCTLYGDMNGGLAVISDVPKTLVYEICRHVNADQEIIPARIIEKPPSAELKPDQTDQDDLPPYEVIDPILKGYVEEAQSAENLVDAGFDSQVVADVIRRVDLNEYKRRQAAPGLKVTPKAFGDGRRYPIAKRFRPL
jgi:NAD+ synthase/NAD+ synthase (glutamine-hydrolysing)